MRLTTLVIAALILVLTATAGLAAFQIAHDARGEAAQHTVERSDSLAVEPDIRQALVTDEDHTPTRFGDSITVTYEGEEWTEGDDYEYFQEDGEIEFLRDEPDEADIDYTYDIPEDQVADDQLQTLTEGFGGGVTQLAGGLVLVVVFLFVGGFTARKMGIGSTPGRGRGR